MRWILPASALVVFAVILGGGHLYYWSTPQHALVQIERALETHDALLLEKHVDVESVIGSAVEGLLAVATQSDASVGDAAPDSAAAQRLKPMLTALAQDALITELVAGDRGDRSPRGDDDMTLADVTNHSSLRRSAFRAVLGVERDGAAAHARILLEEAELDTMLVLTLSLEQRDGSWVFVGIDDLADYIRTVGALQQHRLVEERARGRDYDDWPAYLAARRSAD